MAMQWRLTLNFRSVVILTGYIIILYTRLLLPAIPPCNSKLSPQGIAVLRGYYSLVFKSSIAYLLSKILELRVREVRGKIFFLSSSARYNSKNLLRVPLRPPRLNSSIFQIKHCLLVIQNPGTTSLC